VANDLATRLGSFGVDPRQAAQFGANMVPAAPPAAASAEQAILNPGQFNDETVAKGQSMYDDKLGLQKQALAAKAKAASTIDPMKLQKLRMDLKNDLDADRQRTGNMGTISAKVYASQRLKAVALDEKGGLQNINPIQMQEVSTALATLISGSNVVGEKQIASLVPKTARGDVAKMMEWWSGNPQGADQKEFLKLFVKTADREEKLATTQLQGIMKKRLSAHSLLQQADPEGYKNIVSGYLNNPFEALDSQKQQQAPSPQGGGLPPGLKLIKP
jgi:hypothetical protein